MPHASTDIGREFTRRAEALTAHLLQQEVAGKPHDDAGFATVLAEYFDYFRQLPDLLQTSDIGYTGLYEIDRSLEGFYSDEKMQLFTPSPKEMRSILIDYSALLQKFYLLPRMMEKDARYGKLPGVDRFYARWKEEISQEAGGTEVTEYERSRRDADILAARKEFGTEVRLFLLTRLGEIVLALGIDLDFVQGRLRSYADHIANRELRTDRAIEGEILLNLQALYTLTGDLTRGGVPADVLAKAIRFWSSRDEFLDAVFKQWKWNWQNDYVTPVAWGERAQLIETSDLYRQWVEGQTRLGVGRSFIEHQEHRAKHPTELFQPIPIFLLGRSNVGKSSFFTAINYEVANRGSDVSRKLTFGQQLQAYYDTSQKSWMEGKSVPTAAYTYFDFWRDVDVVGYCTYDYRGGDSEPQQWDPTLQEMFRNSRGIIFMVDNDDLESPEKMRARASWSRTILDYWRNSNPQARHVPIALVINKIDLIMPEALPFMQRTSLFPADLQAAFIENYAVSRYANEHPDTQTPLGRLKDCLLHDPANNVHPRLQDLVYELSLHFSQFFSRVLDVTYHYQIFLMSSRAPVEGDQVQIPWGVLRPVLWMTEILQEEHLAESVATYDTELKGIEGEVEAMSSGLSTLERLKEEIAEHQREVEEERKKRIRFALTQREERIKHLQKLIGDAEADFTRTAESFMDAPPKNKDEVLSVLRRKIKLRSELGESLRKRLKNYKQRREHTLSVA